MVSQKESIFSPFSGLILQGQSHEQMQGQSQEPVHAQDGFLAESADRASAGILPNSNK
jgi:hypothetical protein